MLREGKPFFISHIAKARVLIFTLLGIDSPIALFETSQYKLG